MPVTEPELPADETGAASETASGGRLLFWAGWAVLGVVVLGVAWVVVTGLLARNRLDDARSRLAELRSAVVAGDTARARTVAAAIADDAHSAHALTSGPAWWVASNVPVLGSPLRTSRTLATEADRLGQDVVPGVVRLLQTVPSGATASLSSLDLDAIARATPQLQDAARAASAAYRVVASTDGSWLPVVSDGRDAFARQLRQLDGELTGAARAARIVVPMLGRDGPQRYFLGFLNEAESRGGGGLPGAFAIVRVDRGAITFDRFGADDDLRGVTARVDLGADFDARYSGNDPAGTIQNSNLSPDFSYAARIWAGMWQQKTGERIDGALAVDPTALSYLLRVTGDARLPDGETVSYRNVVALTQQEQYRRFPGLTPAVSEARKRYLISLGSAISSHLTRGGNPAELIKAFSRAAAERRLVVWSRTPAVEAELRTAGWAGALGNDEPRPYSGFVVNNAAGNKLDYYLDRAMTYRRTDCGSGGRATATIALTNNAPRTGLPAYVTFRADTPPPGARPGDNRLLLTYYADRSAQIVSFQVGGRAVPLTVQPEGDTIAVTTTVEIPAGSTVDARVVVAEPRASRPVVILRQPGVRSLRVDESGDRCR